MPIATVPGRVAASLVSLAVFGILHLQAGASEPAADRGGAVTLVEGSRLHGIQGLVWGPDGRLYAGSISGQRISRIDPVSGSVTEVVGPPLGEADDLAISPDGALAWTAIVAGELRFKAPGGSVQVLASGLPAINPVTFGPEGQIFFGQLGPVSTLFEIHPKGGQKARLITKEVDQLNSFEVGADRRLYGPFWESGVLVAIDTNSGAIDRLATVPGTPSAVSLDARGRLISIDYNSGALRRTDPKTGQSELLANLEPPNDNLAVGADGLVYVSDTARSGIIAVDPDSGTQRRLLPGEFATVGGLDLATVEGREVIVAADSTGYRYIDPQTGVVVRPRFDMSLGGSTDVALGPDWVVTTDVRLGRLRKIDRRTRVVLEDMKDLRAPMGVRVLEDGSIVFVEYATGVLSVARGGARREIASGLRGPVGLADGGSGSVLVSEHDAGEIRSVKLADGASRVIARGLDRPEGLAMMADGRVAVAETGRNRVVAIDPATGSIVELAGGLPFGTNAILTPPAVGMPAGIVVDSAGAIYVSCDGDNSVRKISAPGRPAS